VGKPLGTLEDFTLGNKLGSLDGIALSISEGYWDGNAVGNILDSGDNSLGAIEGTTLGAIDGTTLGEPVGSRLGFALGISVMSLPSSSIRLMGSLKGQLDPLSDRGLATQAWNTSMLEIKWHWHSARLSMIMSQTFRSSSPQLVLLAYLSSEPVLITRQIAIVSLVHAADGTMLLDSEGD